MKHKLVLCNVCGKEIASNAKTCPHCGTKIKKPIFKKWWFWVIIILLLAAIGSGVPSSSPSNSKTSLPPSPSPTSARETLPTETSSPIESEPVFSPGQEDSTKETETMGQRNALRAAKNYLNVMAFSYDSLITQLEFEKYEHDDAVYAAENCGADWNEQALKAAKNYLNTSAFSYEGLIRQLEYEKYTTEQATYGVDNCGADWNEQAAKSAKNYLDLMSFSRDSLITQLEFEGFTHDQAVYGAEANGY